MRIAENRNKDNITEFDFVRLENWDDFELIEKTLLQKLEFVKLEELDGIATRKRVFSNSDIKFVLMHDDHVGNFAFCDNEDDVDELRVIVNDVINILKDT